MISNVSIRPATEEDIPMMATIRAREWETEQYWNLRIGGYMKCELHPQKALKPRVIYVASSKETVVGFVAGHLTRRYECDGELEWITITPEYKRRGIASELLLQLAVWFADHNAKRVCVDVEPANDAARRFYRHHRAEDLNPHWMVWNDMSILLTNNRLSAPE